MSNNFISTKKSFDFFLADTTIRSYESCDWISQEIEKLNDGIRYDLCNVTKETRDAFEKIYESMTSVLFESVKISNNGVYFSPKFISYHLKFGWILSEKRGNSNIENKVFLGKMSLLEDTKIIIGRKTYISGPSTIRGGGVLTIGSFCAIAANFFVSTSSQAHPMEYAAMIGRKGNPRFEEDWFDELFHDSATDNHINSVTVGNDVWIGRNVTISYEVVIGDGCVIGHGSFVNKDCKPYGIYAGYPAKLIRYRFSEKHINQLLDIKWWNWSMDLMKKNSVFFNTNLKLFKGNIKDLLHNNC